ncbi:unnamed protein product, partial [Ectocarpus sp. 12 AP-2014]
VTLRILIARVIAYTKYEPLMYQRSARPRHSAIFHHVATDDPTWSVIVKKTKSCKLNTIRPSYCKNTYTRANDRKAQSRVEGRFVLGEFVLQQELVLDDNAHADDEASECAGHSLKDVPESCKRRNGVGRR